eukprot:comp18403_c0_seq2/m.19606 comp18403_c0_seq2/g.19606  ORF comp18403_c0_seq2/g.19606 comp18403_c0_seq2/m.19606 type:complete len:230 (-) comp18403_c0_seq2:919-1608(-)
MQSNALHNLGPPQYKTEEWQLARIRRYLKACDNDVEEAHRMLTAHLDWIHTVQPERIERSEVYGLLRANVLYWHRTDLHGHPTLVFRATKVTEILPSKEDYLKIFMYRMWEFYKRVDNPYGRFVIIYDRQGSHVKKAQMDVWKRLVRFILMHLTEQVHRIYIVKSNHVFRYGLMLLRQVMSPRFRLVFRILDEETWQSQLVAEFGRENLEPDLGGTSVPVTDEEGIIVA